MRRAKPYILNILAALVAIAGYSYLQGCYFFPKVYLRFGRYSSIYLAAVTVIICFIIFWLYKKQLEKGNEWHFNESPHWSGRRLGIAILGFVLIIAAQIVLMRLIGGGSSANQKVLDRIAKSNSSNNDLFDIMVVLIAPFIEETVFRGMFFNTFFTRATGFNKLVGSLVSGLVFAYVHVPRLSKFIFVYWLMGIILAWVYLTSRDLRYSMLVHMGNNLLSLLPLVV